MEIKSSEVINDNDKDIVLEVVPVDKEGQNVRIKLQDEKVFDKIIRL